MFKAKYPSEERALSPSLGAITGTVVFQFAGFPEKPPAAAPKVVVLPGFEKDDPASKEILCITVAPLHLFCEESYSRNSRELLFIAMHKESDRCFAILEAFWKKADKLSASPRARALATALCSPATPMPDRMPMMAITAKSSTRVTPLLAGRPGAGRVFFRPRLSCRIVCIKVKSLRFPQKVRDGFRGGYTSLEPNPRIPSDLK